MSKKRKIEAQPTFVDGEWESNGMYRWYIGPPGKHPKRSEAEQQQSFSEYKTYASQPWPVRLAEWREWLTDMIAPWWEGPLSDDVFWQDKKKGSKGWGHQLVKGGHWYWRRKDEDVGEIVIARASTGDGYYRMVDGVPTGGYIHDAISALCRIDSLEKELAEGADLDSIVRLAIEVGQDIETVRHQAIFAPIVLCGRRAIVDRPKAMQRGKAAHDSTENRRKRQEAKEALALDRRRFPETEKETIRKRRVAKDLKIHVGTLNNRLRKAK